MREYTLYVRNKRSYEVVPVGLSWGALLLGILWAMGNGLTIRYLAVVAITAAPFIFFLIVDESLYGFIAIVGLAAINAGHIYFSLKAFEWREAILNAQGFRPVASIAARSAKEALRTWANSDDALDYV